jgi:hypothetical protein
MTDRTTPVQPRPDPVTIANTEPCKNGRSKPKTGGRQKGTQNILPGETRQQILEALVQIGNAWEHGNGQGIIDFVKKACEENIGYGVKLLGLITPRAVDIAIEEKRTIVYKSVAELDEELARRSAPPLREIFREDYGPILDLTPVEK